MSRRTTSTRKRGSAPALAARLVAEHFEQMITNVCFGSYTPEAVEHAIAEVQQEIAREDPSVADNTSELDRAFDAEGHAREAGYLVGVQVGLRLRKADA